MTTMERFTSTTRNADLRTLVQRLQEDEVRKVDLVVPATALVAHKGQILVKGSSPVLTEDGVTMADGRYVPNSVGVEGIAEKTGIPLAYARTMHAERPDLWSHNVNHWLRGGVDKDHVTHEPDPRSFLLRGFKPVTGDDPGVLRALLSDRYAVMDSLDILTSVLDGLRESGLDPAGLRIIGDLTERRMRLRVVCEEIAALAPVLLAGYRSPYGGATGADNPTVFAGLEISNSETGNGAFTITPKLEIQICSNGMTMTKDAMRNVHLGAKMDHGVVKWSRSTVEKNLALVRSQTVDAVKTFLDVEYVTGAIARMEYKAGFPVNTVEEVRDVTKKAGFTKGQIEDVLGFFVTGGQMTLSGVFNAATAYSQTVEDADVAAEIDAMAASVLL